MTDEIHSLVQLLKEHMLINEGEVAYWGETIPLKQTVHSSPLSEAITRPPAKSERSPAPEVSTRLQLLDALRDQKIGDCRLCPLGSTRIKIVFGVGNPESKVMFIGEGPGFDEDRQGEPFVGKAGQLLDKIIASIGLDRSNIYIANIVKCHPMIDPDQPDKRGNDRPPTPEEMESCLPFLKEQIQIINPRIIVTLGATATKALLARREGISALRGEFYDYKPFEHSSPIQLLPTFHPAALLRDESLKRPVWEDMKLLRDKLLVL